MRNAIMIGERVYLRAFEPSDAKAMAEEDSNEPDTFMSRGRIPVSPLAMEHLITEWYKDELPTSLHIAVCLKENDRCIGDVSLESIDWLNRVAETGSWMFVPEYRGKGYGTEAKHLLIEYAFDHLHLAMLCSTVFGTNTRSAAALAKQGYLPAGQTRYGDVKDGVYRDWLYFDLSRDEWLAARNAWLAGRG